MKFFLFLTLIFNEFSVTLYCRIWNWILNACSIQLTTIKSTELIKSFNSFGNIRLLPSFNESLNDDNDRKKIQVYKKRSNFLSERERLGVLRPAPSTLDKKLTVYVRRRRRPLPIHQPYIKGMVSWGYLGVRRTPGRTTVRHDPRVTVRQTDADR